MLSECCQTSLDFMLSNKNSAPLGRYFTWCRRWDLNPHDYSSLDFESSASAIPPLRQADPCISMLLIISVKGWFVKKKTGCFSLYQKPDIVQLFRSGFPRKEKDINQSSRPGNFFQAACRSGTFTVFPQQIPLLFLPLSFPLCVQNTPLFRPRQCCSTR